MATPKFTPEVQAVIDATIAEGLAIQHKFKPEPLYKYTGKGYMKSDGVEEIARIKEEAKRAQQAAASEGAPPASTV